MRKSRGLILLCPLLLSGCVHLDRPAMPGALAPSSKTTYSADNFHDDYAKYEDAVANSNFDLAKTQRDLMINRIEIEIEQDYRKFEGKLFTNRAAAQTGGDIVELGLSAATGVVGGTDVKDLLAASLTGFKGTRLSFDKNFFREKTTEALISQMQAYRDTVRTRITQKVAAGAKQYPFEEAWRDLVEFFYAGTIPAALQQLANSSGKAATEAKAKFDEIDIKRANTAAEEKSATSVRGRYAALYNGYFKETDPTKKDAALKAAKDALVALGQGNNLNETTTPEQVFEMLRAQMSDALQHPEKIDLLDKALAPPAQP